MSSRQSAIGTLVLGLALVFAGAGPVQASCAEPPTDSPYAFTGTVVEVADNGRVATVVLDDGIEVEVQGGPYLGGSRGTSVDRHYALGGRYEFHPRNAKSPYEDDACSATSQLAGPTVTPVEPARDRFPGWVPVDEQSGPIGYAAVGGMPVLAIASIGVLAILRARRLQMTRRTRVRVER